MSDSFSEGSVYPGRTLLVLLGVIALTMLAQLI